MSNLLIFVCLFYASLLFLIAFGADRAALRGRTAWLRSPLVYTLSLSIYCTAWTFYGAVGFAARSGLEFVTIYLGPTLVMIGWWWLLQRMVRLGRAERVTSIADLISSRFGKSNTLAVLVTLIAVIGTTPYIALQLQSVTLSFEVFAGWDDPHMPHSARYVTALWIAVGLVVFTILFGTRNLDANERHHGVVMAVAIEAIVKLIALLAVGIFVVWGVGDGPSDIIARIDASDISDWQVPGSRWVGLTFLSAAAFLCLPRMFQVMVVENEDDNHLRTASWAFPAYMLLISLFVLPIAVVGLDVMPEGANPDLYVLTLPLEHGWNRLAFLSFIGGFSSATSMVVVATIALSTMVSNQIVMPIWLRATEGTATMSGDVRFVALLSRRLAIAGVLFLGYLYFRFTGGGTALASIGLVAFTGVAQFLPALIGGIFWRGATRAGALAGLSVGFVVWLYCSFLPSFGTTFILPEHVLTDGLFGFDWLRPLGLFGTHKMDPVIHAFFWSMLLNSMIFIIVSLAASPHQADRYQQAQFSATFPAVEGQSARLAEAEGLLLMTQRIIGASEAQSFFAQATRAQGLSGYLPEPSSEFLLSLERKLSGSVGTATAHAMVSQAASGSMVSVEDLMAVADETAQIMEYSSQLEAKSQELTRTARQLRDVNQKLTQLSLQKDDFLSQVSHELRTPMTSIRAFSEILRDADGLEAEAINEYASIIHNEAVRLTRLLDDLLDLSVLDSGQTVLNLQSMTLDAILDRSVVASGVNSADIQLRRDRQAEQIALTTDVDRLSQVFINLLSNARKYCDAKQPVVTITARVSDSVLMVDVLDNGSGISAENQSVIFEKFSRVGQSKTRGAGLGLAICREIMTRLKGKIVYLPGQNGAAFRVSLPLVLEKPSD